MLNPDQIYHMYNHANGTESLFRNEDNFSYFLQRFDNYISLVAYTFAYCLMPNHFHFLVKIKDEKTIIDSAFQKFGTFGKLTIQEFVSKQFSNLFSSYTQSYNKVYFRKGSLFIPNFKYNQIDNSKYLSNVIVYIHMNPVLHGFVKKPEEWKYSSFNAFSGEKKTKISINEVMDEIKTTRFDFIKLHNLHDAEKFSLDMSLMY